MARRKLIVAVVIAAAGLPAAAVLAWLLLAQFDAARNSQPIDGLAASRMILIAPGSSLAAVARQLEAEGLLAHPASWVRMARREGLAGRLRAGEFEVKPGSTPRSLLEQIVSGAAFLHSLTIPEGWTFSQALRLVQQHPAVVPVLDAADEGALRAALGLGEVSLEGMLFPDTYLFPRGTRDIEILRPAHERLEERLAAAWSARRDGLPLNGPYQALILASIVEKETGVADERPVIAGVFVNRLRLGMRLQTDPTVIYGLGDAFDGNLRRADLERDTPFNTYTRSGLPPTPIALAGEEALLAAVEPAETDALYFVATGRGDGRHRFARTLAEHNENVARYIAAVRGAARGGT